MAAISQKANPEEILPFLARNIVVEGYRYKGEKPDEPTEYLKILRAYLKQVRELQTLAGLEGVIQVRNCQEAQPLLATLGYRLREGCGQNTLLETADAARAFLAADANFPLVELEESLRDGKPFSLPFASTKVPVLFHPNDWAAKEKEIVDALMEDPGLSRLYWALSRMDSSTQSFLRQSLGIPRLLPFAAALDFYGGHLSVRSGRVMVPGGVAAESSWKNLVGASPSSPAEFVTRLLEKDAGWLMAYFDTLSRLPRSQQTYFTEPRRLERYYIALRGKDLSPVPTRSVFRPVPNLFLLAARLFLDTNGQPHVPGNLEIWKEIFRRKSDSKLVRDLAKQANRWRQPDDLVEAMFALTRNPVGDSPLPVYLLLSEIDRRRPASERLKPQTVRLLAEKFFRYGPQYPFFTEWSMLGDDSIQRFITVAETLDRISDGIVRANALGIFQANIGFWQILARQGQIPANMLNDSWQRFTQPFIEIKSSSQLMKIARISLNELWRAAGQTPNLSQAEIISLLAGPPQTNARRSQVQQEVADRIRSILETQRLVSLDAVFALDDGLSEAVSQEKTVPESLVRLAGQLQEFEPPQPIFTRRERSEWASGLHNNPHMDFQLRRDVAGTISKASNSSRRLEEARGLLTPFLRDTLVGLNYAYYEPPGAMTLHSNSLFVRNHDFSGQRTPGRVDSWQSARMFGRGWTASGGAHLVGSLADLPYALAQMEQDFLVPENVQSLIWADLVPGLITSAVLPRWWNVTPEELRAVALYQQWGEDLLTAAAADASLRQKVMEILYDCLLPQRWEQVELVLQQEQPGAALERLMPAELFFLAAEFRRLYPNETEAWGSAGQELEKLAQQHPAETSWERISQDFGVPHPALASTYARELFILKPLPTFLGYSSRLLAESWESTNLYWARLAEEGGYPPAVLQSLIPVLTQRMAEKIFASHLEDWPALLRALRETGNEFRLGKVASLPAAERAPGL
ncbi:MAG: hypothetical protein HY313_11215 [Acidobacteria bacterium]|nr:hypothetical protein [Acidobacteriota bacterium]